MTVAGNASTILYVSGVVTAGNHLDVNIPSSGLPDARALLIFSLGSSVAIGNHTNVAAAIWAPLADGGGPSNAQLMLTFTARLYASRSAIRAAGTSTTTTR